MKRFGKRIVSTVLVTAMLAAMVGGHSYYAAESANLSDQSGRVRGVVIGWDDWKKFTDQPDYDKAEVGTKEHPFLVLEIVPSMEYAEFGYLVGGCEPVEIDKINDDSVGKLVDLGILQDAADYGYGYYERVEAGNGSYMIDDSVFKDYLSSMDASLEVKDVSDPAADGEPAEEDADASGRDTVTEAPAEGMDAAGQDVITEAPAKDAGAADQDAQAVEPEASFETGARLDDDDYIVLTSLTEEIDVGDMGGDSGNDAVGNGDNAGNNDAGNAGAHNPADGAGEAGGESDLTKDLPAEIPGTDLDAETDEADAGLSAAMPVANVTCKVTVTYVGYGNGDWEWHFLSEVDNYDRYYYNLNNVDVTYDLKDLQQDFNKGEIYAQKWQGDVVGHPAAFYKNTELFLRNSLLPGASDETVAGYSIVVKTTTPDELNGNQGWIDYADLIYLSSVNGNEDLLEIWKDNSSYRRLKNEDSQGTESMTKNWYEVHDLTWDTALKLYNKVTAETNFAGLIVDDSIFDLREGSGFYTDSTVNRNTSVKIYDWNLEDTGSYYYNVAGCSSNIYKLAVMLQAMDSRLFKSLYLSPNDSSDAIIRAEGNSQQNGDAKNYWSVRSFLLKNPYMTWEEYYALGSDDWWENCHSILYATDSDYRYYVNNHMFICPGDVGIVAGYSGALGNVASDYIFNEYLTEKAAKGMDAKLSPANAVGYILEAGMGEQSWKFGTIRVLDIEPTVTVVNGSPQWRLTDSYVRMLAPFYGGKIEIVHRTMEEFVGMHEDLAGEYQMIYLGVGASKPEELQDSIYTRTKDISERKVEELEAFLRAGRPIVVERYFYEPTGRIETDSNIYKFVDKYVNENLTMLFKIRETGKSGRAILQLRKIADIEGPREYTGTKDSYLSSASLEFTIKLNDYDPNDPGDPEKYRYRIYVDRDGDLEFEQDGGYSELLKEAWLYTRPDNVVTPLVLDPIKISCPLPDEAGLVHWRIEVYDSKDVNNREVLTGFSAVDGNQEKIRILQISNNASENVSTLNSWLTDLGNTASDEKGIGFKNYQIPVDDGMTPEKYIEIFKDTKFTYDKTNGSSGLENLNEDLMNYNMIIVNLGSAPNVGNLFSAASGDPDAVAAAAAFLQYWEDMGRSIIYLHDSDSTYVSAAAENNEISQIAANAPTTTVSRLNRGLSLYPFNLGEENLAVTAARAQGPALNPEDETVTVWYCLAGGDYAWNNAMNGYYIYSKNNVFHSSIGYSEKTKDVQKLFVNTMIAAYNASDSGPVVMIGNSGAEDGANQTYEIRELMRDYDVVNGVFESAGDIVGSSLTYPISFTLVESDPYITASYTCAIQYYNKDGSAGDYALEMHDKSGNRYTARQLPNTDIYVFSGLKENTTYILEYKNEYMDSGATSDFSWNRIKFKIDNNSRSYTATLPTVVNMSEQPLFPLD